MAPNTRSRSGNASNPGSMRIHSASASTSTQNPPPSEQTLQDKCETVLELIKNLGLTFGEFVLAVSYGESDLRTVPSAVEARGTLYSEKILPEFLELCLKPPRGRSGGGDRPVGGSKITRRFIFETAKQTFRSELEAFSVNYKLPKNQLGNMDYIKTINSTSLYERIKLKCPELCSILNALSNPREPDAEEEVQEDDADEPQEPHKLPIERHPHFDTTFQITSMAYRLNSQRNALQKISTIYVHVRHTAKPVIDMFHQTGNLMSYSWVRSQVSNLSLAIRHEMLLAVRTNPFVMVHDNIRLKHPVRSQRGDNQSVSDNGTAAAVIILANTESAQTFKKAAKFLPFLRDLRDERRAGTAKRLCYEDLDHTGRSVYNRTSYIFDVLEILATIPELTGLDVWKSGKLKRPVGPRQLPSGPEHRLKQYMLPTTNIDESSYSGNAQFVPFALNQLGFNTAEERTRLVLETLIAWIGDRMTAQRCRQVQAFLQECINGYARWDMLMFIFGGLHCMMALGSSILEQYRGSNVGATFGADIILLSRTGLQKPTGGSKLDYHTVDEFLQHELNASTRGLFDELTGCSTSESRTDWAKKCTPRDLYNLAESIVSDHASTGAIQLDDSDDEQRTQTIQRQRDLLLFHSLRRAFKYGDVDRIEAILPELLYYFIGAGNGQYADEVYVFLQLLTHETTPEMKDAILQHALVVNKLGRPDSFYPIDQRQELNNKGIREYGPPPQNSSWEQYGKVSPVIPFYMDIIEHVEGDVSGISRSHVRKAVKAEMDIQALMNEHKKHKVHTIVPGRKLKAADKAKDAQKAGVTAIRDKGYLNEQYEKRAVYYKASSTLQQQVSIPTPPPSPRNVSPIDLEDEDTESQSTGTSSYLEEDGMSPQHDDPAVEALTAAVVGMGLDEAD
ncbi:hypothetical protein FRC12_006423 [Ceratobasidium sp. 428]|nr:hypothetical protein FRC12_006423 [Ceratobasidium sp. 428]